METPPFRGNVARVSTKLVLEHEKEPEDTFALVSTNLGLQVVLCYIPCLSLKTLSNTTGDHSSSAENTTEGRHLPQSGATEDRRIWHLHSRVSTGQRLPRRTDLLL